MIIFQLNQLKMTTLNQHLNDAEQCVDRLSQQFRQRSRRLTIKCCQHNHAKKKIAAAPTLERTTLISLCNDITTGFVQIDQLSNERQECYKEHTSARKQLAALKRKETSIKLAIDGLTRRFESLTKCCRHCHCQTDTTIETRTVVAKKNDENLNHAPSLVFGTVLSTTYKSNKKLGNKKRRVAATFEHPNSENQFSQTKKKLKPTFIKQEPVVIEDGEEIDVEPNEEKDNVQHQIINRQQKIMNQKQTIESTIQSSPSSYMISNIVGRAQQLSTTNNVANREARSYNCKYCPATFPTNVLTTHIRTQHPDKCYQCSHCSKLYLRRKTVRKCQNKKN